MNPFAVIPAFDIFKDCPPGFLEILVSREINFLDPNDKVYLTTHRFYGKNLSECVKKFENATIFDRLTIYEAEKEIEVLFG